jgi:ABC-type branched-subunit amino acid transport system substrate-binding protein
LALVVALAVLAAGCGGDEEAAAPAPAPTEEAAPPAAEPAATEPAEPAATEPAATEPAAPAAEGCQLETKQDGQITIFETHDLAGVIGTISEHAVRAQKIWLDEVNAAGGVMGCQVVLDYVDEPFSDDPAQCLNNYREAIQSGKYDFYLGPVNSACMFALPDLTKAAGQFVFSGIAADHQPYMENYQKQGPYIMHPAVSTFLEGRASAQWAYDNGYRKVALMVPNYAYGQDVGKAFTEYFEQLGGEIVDQQEPEFNEENFTPFINAMLSKDPDLIVTAFFGNFIVPFWKQWKASGNDQDIPTISGLAFSSTFEVEGLTENDIPANTWAYDRGDWHLRCGTPVGRQACDDWVAAGNEDLPIIGDFGFVVLGGMSAAKAIIEQTQSLNADDWVAYIESGEFTYDGPYNAGPTAVNPVNHMADDCAEVGQIVWNPDLPKFAASFDPATLVPYCMRDVLPADEVRTLTDNPDVSDEALQTYLTNTEQAGDNPVVDTWPPQ